MAQRVHHYDDNWSSVDYLDGYGEWYGQCKRISKKLYSAKEKKCIGSWPVLYRMLAFRLYFSCAILWMRKSVSSFIHTSRTTKSRHRAFHRSSSAYFRDKLFCVDSEIENNHTESVELATAWLLHAMKSNPLSVRNEPLRCRYGYGIMLNIFMFEATCIFGKYFMAQVWQ
jgi:hypothetical protein